LWISETGNILFIVSKHNAKSIQSLNVSTFDLLPWTSPDQPGEFRRFGVLEGPVMVKARSDSVAVSIDAVINSLRNQGIPVRGLCTQHKGILFLVEGYILLESELVELFAQNKLNRDGIEELGKRIEAHSQ
jgi:hypothetical protein